MSGADKETPPDPDRAMEDILDTIRRILMEDEAGKPAPAEPPAPPPAEDVLLLGAEMLDPGPAPEAERSQPAPPPEAVPVAPAPQTVAPLPMPLELHGGHTGPAPQTDPQTEIYRGGPTLEDLVRAEIRPLLQTWLEANLPPLIERLVQAEVARRFGQNETPPPPGGQSG
jgi:uncharacterized protein